jgi:hypothetical protein
MRLQTLTTWMHDTILYLLNLQPRGLRETLASANTYVVHRTHDQIMCSSRAHEGHNAVMASFYRWIISPRPHHRKKSRAHRKSLGRAAGLELCAVAGSFYGINQLTVPCTPMFEAYYKQFRQVGNTGSKLLSWSSPVVIHYDSLRHHRVVPMDGTQVRRF